MKKLDARQLKQLKERERELPVVDVLPENSFRKKHIPGAINVPVEKDDFVRRVKSAVGEPDGGLVVYCAGADCDASPRAAKKLEQAGFRGVYDFEGGLEEWERADLPLEGAAVA